MRTAAALLLGAAVSGQPPPLPPAAPFPLLRVPNSTLNSTSAYTDDVTNHAAVNANTATNKIVIVFRVLFRDVTNATALNSSNFTSMINISALSALPVCIGLLSTNTTSTRNASWLNASMGNASRDIETDVPRVLFECALGALVPPPNFFFTLLNITNASSLRDASSSSNMTSRNSSATSNASLWSNSTWLLSNNMSTNDGVAAELPVWSAPELTGWKAGVVANVSLVVPPEAEAHDVDAMMSYLRSPAALSDLTTEVSRLAFYADIELDWEIASISSPMLLGRSVDDIATSEGAVQAVVTIIVVLIALGLCRAIFVHRRKRALIESDRREIERVDQEVDRLRCRRERRRHRRLKRDQINLRLAMGVQQDADEEDISPPSSSTESDCELIPSEEPNDERTPYEIAAVTVQRTVRAVWKERAYQQALEPAVRVVQAALRRAMASPQWEIRCEVNRLHRERIEATRVRALSRILNRRLAAGFGSWMAMIHAREEARRRLRECANRFMGGTLAMTFYSWRDSMSESEENVELARRTLARIIAHREAVIAAAERSLEQIERMALQIHPVAWRLDEQRLEVLRLNAKVAEHETAVREAQRDGQPDEAVAELHSPAPPIGGWWSMIRHTRSAIQIAPALGPSRTAAPAQIAPAPAGPNGTEADGNEANATEAKPEAESLLRTSRASARSSQPTQTLVEAVEAWRALGIASVISSEEREGVEQALANVMLRSSQMGKAHGQPIGLGTPNAKRPPLLEPIFSPVSLPV